MKFIVHKYYTTFETIQVEADSVQEAIDKANDQEEVSTEEIMSNLERLEESDNAHQ